MGVKRNNVLNFFKEYSIITFSLFLYALGWTAFLIPSEIVGGGLSGIGALVYYSTGLPVGYTVFGINAILILIAIKMLGRGFGVKTIYSFVMMSFFLALMQEIITEPFVDDKFMSAIIGGILCGASVGLVFAQGGSTGGTDIIAMIINKYRKISPGRVILACDLVIISSSYFLFQSVEVMVYGYVTMAVTAYVIDMVLVGSKQSVQVMIISRFYNEIADSIGAEGKRGITLLNGRGWYTKKDFNVVMIVVRKNEMQYLFRTVKGIDPEAFVSVASVMGVYGKGFDRIR